MLAHHLVDALEPRTLLAVHFGSLITVGIEESPETPVSIAVDAGGNTYVAGTFGDTVNFNPNGRRTALASVGGADIFIAKYTPAGALVWARRIGNSSDDLITDMVIDARGNVYLTGQFARTLDADPGKGVYNLQSRGGADVYIIKLTSSGAFAWAGSIGGRFDDTVSGLAVAPSGNLYMAGLFLMSADLDPGSAKRVVNSADTADVYLLKLNTSGRLLWQKAIQGDGDRGYYVRSSALSIGPAEDLYLCGTFSGRIDFDPGAGVARRVADDVQAYLLRLSSQGTLVFADAFGADGAVTPKSLAVDSTGAAVVLGSFTDDPDFDPGPNERILTELGDGTGDMFLSRITRSGKLSWVRQAGGSDAEIVPTAVTTDAAGNVLVTGAFVDTVYFGNAATLTADADQQPEFTVPAPDGANLFLTRYSSSGALSYARRIGGDQAALLATDVVVSSGGTIHLLGMFAGTADFAPGAQKELRQADGDGDMFVLTLLP